jgi:hypothetical protein
LGAKNTELGPLDFVQNNPKYPEKTSKTPQKARKSPKNTLLPILGAYKKDVS